MEIINIVLDFLCFLAPIMIWSTVREFLKEHKRHNQAVELRLDFIFREIKKLTAEE